MWKQRCLMICGALVAFGASALAQRAELFGDYTFMQYNPTITGVSSRALHGGGGGAQLNFAKIFGLKGEFQGYMSTQVTVDVKSPISTPRGILPVGTYKSNATMFTYLLGPVVRIPGKHVRPFGELLFGGTNTNLYAQLNSALIAGGGKIDATGQTQHPFAMAFGGGWMWQSIDPWPSAWLKWTGWSRGLPTYLQIRTTRTTFAISVGSSLHSGHGSGSLPGAEPSGFAATIPVAALLPSMKKLL